MAEPCGRGEMARRDDDRAIAANVIAAFASIMTGPIRRRAAADREPVGEELAAVAGEGTWEPSELVLPVAGEADASRAARQAAGAPRAAANVLTAGGLRKQAAG